VHPSVRIAYPHAMKERASKRKLQRKSVRDRPRDREKEREREDQALGPWRNQFKWLSVDVIDFHFTRLSGKMLLYPLRCVHPHPRVVAACILYRILSLSLSVLSLCRSISPSLFVAVHVPSSRIASSLPFACFSYLSLSPAPAAHACGAYACIERINTHYNVSAGALETREEERRRGRAVLPGIIVFSRLVPR